METDKLEALLKARIRPTQYDGYFVDDAGNVWSALNWRGKGFRMLAPKPNSHGYPAVKVKVQDGVKKMLVHKEVCAAFHGPKPSPQHQVRHLDGTRDNNAAHNLAWGTISENAKDRVRHGKCRAADNGRTSSARRVMARAALQGEAANV